MAEVRSQEMNLSILVAMFTIVFCNIAMWFSAYFVLVVWEEPMGWVILVGSILHLLIMWDVMRGES